MSSSTEVTLSEAEGPCPPPCAGCKHLRRRCVPDCAFAAYFQPDHGDRFAAVHKVFGASNVSKLLAEAAPAERAGVVESLVYEATARLRDPALGCASYITVLQHALKLGRGDLAAARGELAGHVGVAAAFRPFEPARASPEARRAGDEQLEATLRFAKERDERMRAVRVAVEAKRKQGRAEAWKDAVKRGQGQPMLNQQMAEAQQAAAAAQSARELTMKMQQAAAAQQHGHRSAMTGQQGFPEGHVQGHPRHLTVQQMANAQKLAAADQVAREQDMMIRQPLAATHKYSQRAEDEMLATAAAASWEQQQMKMMGEDELYYHPAAHYGAMGREHPNSSQLQMAHAQQLAAAEDATVWEQAVMFRQAAAAAAELTRDKNVMILLQQAVGEQPHQNMMTGLQQQTEKPIANAQLLPAAVAMVREQQDLTMMQQQAAAYAHAMPAGSVSGATNMAL